MTATLDTTKAAQTYTIDEMHSEVTDKHAIQDVLSQYVRATDERNGDAQAKLFADNGMIRFFGRSGTEEYQLAGEPVIGAERIRRHMERFFPPASGADVPAPHHHRPPHQGQRCRGDHECAVPRVLVGRRAEAGGRLAGPAGSEGRHHADHDRLLRLGSTQDRWSVEVDPARREAQSAGVHGLTTAPQAPAASLTLLLLS